MVLEVDGASVVGMALDELLGRLRAAHPRGARAQEGGDAAPAPAPAELVRIRRAPRLHLHTCPRAAPARPHAR